MKPWYDSVSRGRLMKSGDPKARSHLFTLRLWLEEVDGGHSEWRGKVQHVLDGEAGYFRDWATLIDRLVAMLPDPEWGRTQQRDEGD